MPHKEDGKGSLLNAAIPSFRWSSQVNLKLERIQSLVELLGNPQTSYPAIHIGGTSGKGTVAAMTASILSHHGRRTGLHLSPYVQTLTETWQLDGRYSLPSRILPVARLVTETAKNIPLMPASGPVSYFELNVAIALKLFAEERVDTCPFTGSAPVRGDLRVAGLPSLGVLKRRSRWLRLRVAAVLSRRGAAESELVLRDVSRRGCWSVS
jgi:hypothetical protein